MAIKNVGKIRIKVNKTGQNYSLSFDVKKDQHGNTETNQATGPNPANVKAEGIVTAMVKVTNPCIWINIGGNWRRICW